MQTWLRLTTSDRSINLRHCCLSKDFLSSRRASGRVNSGGNLRDATSRRSSRFLATLRRRRAFLYGWKFKGPVSAARPLFYEPFQKMLDDPELMRDRGAVEDLAKLKGGFFIPGSEIAYVEATDRSKWGMGGIPHSGRIRIGLTTGKWREFILLGSVSPEMIRDRVQSSAASVRV